MKIFRRSTHGCGEQIVLAGGLVVAWKRLRFPFAEVSDAVPLSSILPHVGLASDMMSRAIGDSRSRKHGRSVIRAKKHGLATLKNTHAYSRPADKSAIRLRPIRWSAERKHEGKGASRSAVQSVGFHPTWCVTQLLAQCDCICSGVDELDQIHAGRLFQPHDVMVAKHVAPPFRRHGRCALSPRKVVDDFEALKRRPSLMERGGGFSVGFVYSEKCLSSQVFLVRCLQR